MGYESTETDTVLRSVRRDNGTLLVKLEDSPFYAEGGGQVADGGLVEAPTGRARVADVLRLGSDQALALEPLEGELVEGERVHAVVERDARLATMRNHTATHLLHAALRERLGTHVRQAGSYVGPDKLRFDFTHGERLSREDLRAVEDRVNGWIAAATPYAPSRPAWTRRARWGPWPCSARSTATGCGWWRWTRCRASCVAAHTWPARPRSGSST